MERISQGKKALPQLLKTPEISEISELSNNCEEITETENKKLKNLEQLEEVNLKNKYSQELISIIWKRLLEKESITNADDIIGTRITIDNIDFNKFWSSVKKQDLEDLIRFYKNNKAEQLIDFVNYGSEEMKFIPEKGIFTSADTSFFDNKISELQKIKNLLQD